MPFRSRFILAKLLISLIFIFPLGCAKKIPQDEINAAREALERARQAGATELEEYKVAENYLRQAEEHLEKKEYDEAKTKAIISKEFSELAIKKWNEMAKRQAEEEPKRKVEIVETEMEFKRPNLPKSIKGVNPDEIIGTSAFGRGYRLKSLKNVYFDYDSFNISEEMKEIIRQNADIIKRILNENPELSILIEGHCDERGTNEYNLELGWKRSQSVKRILMLFGIPEEKIQMVSYGEEFPEEPCTPPNCQDETKWSKNRRAVFVITTKE